MLGLDMLDVAIGVIFVYLVLSLVATAAVETFERFLKYRASDLERGVRELLRNDKLVEELYNHPLINGLYVGSYQDAKKIKELPSYMPARSFALALMDLVFPSQEDSAGGTTGATHSAAEGASTISHPNLEVLRTKLAEAQDPTMAKTPMPAALQNVEVEVARALMLLIDAAQHDAAKARENIEGWFNTGMDRVSGWFKRRTQTFLMVLGVVVAVALNADTIAMIRKLSVNKAARETIVSQAEAYAKSNPTPKQPASVEASLNNLGNYALPIGWQNYGCSVCWPHRMPFTLWPTSKQVDICWVGGWLMKLLGWLMTAGAISLGAPFWFDTLNKIIVVRSTIKPHEKSPEEKSKS